MPPLTISADELVSLTGYRQTTKQLAWLKAQGFWTDKAAREGRAEAQKMGAHSTERQTADYIDGRVTPMTKATR